MDKLRLVVKNLTKQHGSAKLFILSKIEGG